VTEFVGHRDRVLGAAVAAARGLVVSCSSDRSVRVWRLDNGAPVASLIGHTPMRTLRLSPDHGIVAVGDASGRVHLLRLP
jgi:WD40 repeat protein